MQNQIYYLILGILVLLVIILTIMVLVLFKRKPKQELSKEQNENLNFIFNALDEGLILIDQNKTIRLFNPASSKLTGWDTDDAIGLDINLVIKPLNTKGEPIPEEENPIIKVFRSKSNIHNTNLMIINKKNANIAIDVNAYPVIVNDLIVSAVILFRNVTDERLEEERLVDFISTASHEMRTPVAAIEGYLSLAMNDRVSNIDDNARNYLEKAHQTTKHLGQLFQDLLTSAKAEDGRLSNHPTAIELGGFLKQLVEDLKFSAEKKNLKIELVVGSEELMKEEIKTEKVIIPFYYVYADPDRLREVITNLFDNAVKFTPEGGITVGITSNQEVVQVFVKDTGVGIPAEDINHLFQKFYRVDNSATRTIGGTGLGLFIARKIVELYNGKIWVESILGKGSTFYINLPKLSAEKVKLLTINPPNEMNKVIG